MVSKIRPPGQVRKLKVCSVRSLRVRKTMKANLLFRKIPPQLAQSVAKKFHLNIDFVPAAGNQRRPKKAVYLAVNSSQLILLFAPIVVPRRLNRLIGKFCCFPIPRRWRSSCLPAHAVVNAIFDATGVRLRQMPFTLERVRAGLIERLQSSRVVLRSINKALLIYPRLQIAVNLNNGS